MNIYHTRTHIYTHIPTHTNRRTYSSKGEKRVCVKGEGVCKGGRETCIFLGLFCKSLRERESARAREKAREKVWVCVCECQCVCECMRLGFRV